VLLAHYFVEKYNRDFGTEIRAFSPDTLPILLQHDWPGNVRELENAIRATLVMARGSVLYPEFLPDWVRGSSPDRAPAAQSASAATSEAAPPRSPDALFAAAAEAALEAPSSGAEPLFHEAVARLEMELIRNALRAHRGRIAPAAERLGISRTTLRRKMQAYGVDITTT